MSGRSVSAGKEYVPPSLRSPAFAKYINARKSPTNSENNNVEPVDPENLRPEINLNALQHRRPKQAMPNGVFTEYNDNTLESKLWGNAPFFPNAKPASMKERGLRISESEYLEPGKKGVLIDNDGPELEVTVVEDCSKNNNNIYKFVDASGIIHERRRNERYEGWDFYIPTPAKPFVPIPRRRGGYKKTRKSRKQKKTRKSRK